MEKVNILVVDDRPEGILAVRAVLNSPGHNIITASSGTEALKQLELHDFALILIEANMPVMNGFETAYVIKSRERCKDIPIIFMSAKNHGEPYVYQGYGVGAVDYLLKPIDPYILRSKVTIFVDLYRKNLEEKKLNYDMYRAAIEARNDFLSIASHELNTPITSLKLQLQMIKRSLFLNKDGQATLEKFSKSVDTSVRQVDRLICLVQVILDASKIHSGSFSYNFEKMNAREVIAEVVDRHSEFLQCSSCQLNVTNVENLEVVWDKARIDQVISSLLTNAIKYAPGKIALSVREDNDQVIITVLDNGKGIPATRLHSIFDQYERAESQGGVGGLGLGLYIVKQITEDHQGKIEVTSEENKGTAFTVRLPKEVRPIEQKLLHQEELIH